MFVVTRHILFDIDPIMYRDGPSAENRAQKASNGPENFTCQQIWALSLECGNANVKGVAFNVPMFCLAASPKPSCAYL